MDGNARDGKDQQIQNGKDYQKEQGGGCKDDGSGYSGLWDNNEMRNPNSMKTCDVPVQTPIQGTPPPLPAGGPTWDQVSQSMETAELLRAYLRRSFKKKK